MNRSYEIKLIFNKKLNHDLIDLILNFEKEFIYRESLDYWIEINPLYKIPLEFINNKRFFHLNHIKRINGSLQNIKEEKIEIKILKVKNNLLNYSL
tara:strand:- start:711 stop:998 length:288 start_codon:yes stop_codon:yes gene_type:complete